MFHSKVLHLLLYVKNGCSVTGAAGTDPQLGRPVSESVLNGGSSIV